jgi:phage-related protein
MITKILNFLKSRILVFVPTILGIAESVVKFIKELITLVVDVLYPIIPNATFKVIVTKIRAVVESIYTWIGANKEKILNYLNLIP